MIAENIGFDETNQVKNESQIDSPFEQITQSSG